MADNQDVQEILLRIKTDKSEISKTLKDISSFKSALYDAKNGVGDLDKTNVDKLKKQIGESTEKLRRLREELRSTREDLDNLPTDIPIISSISELESGGARGSGLRNFGSQLRQLPSMPIPGTGITTDAVANVIRLAGAVQMVSGKIPALTTVTEALTPALGASAAGFTAVALPVAAVAAAAIPLALAVKSVSDEIDRNVKAYQAELDALKQETDFKNQNITDVRTKTAEQNRQEAEDQQQKIKNQQAYISNLRLQREAINKEYTDLGASFDPAKRKELTGKGDEVDKQIEAATTELIKLGEQAQNTVLTLGPEIDAREKERLAIEAQNKATNDRATIIVQDAQTQAKVAAEIRTLTKDQVEARLSAIKDEKNGIQDQINQLSALPNRTDEVTKKLQQLGTQMDALGKESQGLSANINNLPAELKKQADAEAKTRKDSIDSWKKYSEDVIKINADEKQALIDLDRKYVDTQVAIAKQAVEAAESALAKLTDQRASLALSFARAGADAETQRQSSELDARISFARQEVRDTRDHLARLQEIQNQASADGEDAIRRRDFSALFSIRRRAVQATDNENKAYQQQRADRIEAFNQEAEDRNRHFAEDAQLRLIKYQRDLQDAATQYQKERTAAETNRRKALAEAFASYSRDQQLLRNKYQAERDARQQSITAELQQIQAGNAAKLALEQQYYIALENFLRAQLSNVGNVGSNSFSGASSPGPSSVNYSPTYNISNATDANAVAKIVDRKNAQFFGALNK